MSCASTGPDVVAPAAQGDDFEIRATVVAAYNVISGPAGRRDWKRFTALFAPGGIIVAAPVGVDAKEAVLTPEQYEALWTPRLNETGLFQWPVATRVVRYGDVAQAWSVYEERRASNDPKPVARGVKSFQFVRIGESWKVQSIVTQVEDPSHPIPAELLIER